MAAVADLDAATGGAPRRASSAPPPFRDVRALLAGAEVDAVDVCLPITCTGTPSSPPRAPGKHVLCEKPLCLTAAEAAEVRGAVAAAGITLMCAHNQLFLPAVAAAKARARGRRARHGLRGPHDRQLPQRLRPRVDGLARARRHERRRRADRHGLSPVLPDAPPRGRRARRGRRDALHAPAAVHGGRGLGAGARALRQRRRRPAGHELGLRPGAGRPSASRPSASSARCTATGRR